MLAPRLSALLAFAVAAVVALAFAMGAVVQPARSLSAAAQQGQSRTEEEEREKDVDGAEERLALERLGHGTRLPLVAPRARRLRLGRRAVPPSVRLAISPGCARARAPERRQL